MSTKLKKKTIQSCFAQNLRAIKNFVNKKKLACSLSVFEIFGSFINFFTSLRESTNDLISAGNIPRETV